jgi:multiple sugar transport system ATP-binding protein
MFVAGFVGSPAMNLIRGNLKEGRVVIVPGQFEFMLDAAGKQRLAGSEGTMTFGIRSEDIRIGPEEAVEARVHDVENHGVEKIVTLRVDGCHFRATVPAVSRVAIEDTVRFSWDQEKLHGFENHSGASVTRH